MASEGSVAPKERVNIVYKPATGDAKEELELPLKLLVVGDFTGRADESPVEDRKPINVDKDNFNDVLKAHNLSVDLAVPNKLDDKAKQNEELAVTLKFRSLKDFEPDAIVEQVPELRNLLELRDALKALKGPLGNVPAFKKKIQDLIKDEGAKQRILAELGIQDKS